MAINQIIIPNLPKIPTQQQIRTDIGNATFDLPGLGRPSSPDPSKDTPKSRESRNLFHGNMQDKAPAKRPDNDKKPYRSTISQRGGKFSVENFTSKVANDLLIPNTYALFIPAPEKILKLPSSKGMLENLTMRIDNIELPGKQLETEEVIYYGPSRKSAFSMSYEDLSFNVYLSKDLKERDFFSAWMDLAFNYDTSHISYYKDIVKTCTFHSYDKSSPVDPPQSTVEYTRNIFDTIEKEELEKFSKYSVIFEEAYPIQMGAITYAYSSEEIARLPVTMTYRKWKKVN